MHKGKWGGGVRARIKFRKRGLKEPNEDEKDKEGTSDPEEVTAADIREAFDKGEEVSPGYQSVLYSC